MKGHYGEQRLAVKCLNRRPLISIYSGAELVQPAGMGQCKSQEMQAGAQPEAAAAAGIFIEMADAVGPRAGGADQHRHRMPAVGS